MDRPPGLILSLIFNLLNMFVNTSFRAFSEVLRDLRGAGSVCLPSEVVPAFVSFCNDFGVYPLGGAVVLDPENNLLQYLYI